MTVSDLHGKLREANVFNLDQVKCVIAETTGDVSVLHSDTDCNIAFSDDLFNGIIGSERLKGLIVADIKFRNTD